jgi:hypothetical protein
MVREPPGTAGLGDETGTAGLVTGDQTGAVGLVTGGQTGAVGLVAGDTFREWSFTGYGPPTPLAPDTTVELLTPPASVAALRAGYRPLLHPSADLGPPPSVRERRPPTGRPRPPTAPSG